MKITITLNCDELREAMATWFHSEMSEAVPELGDIYIEFKGGGTEISTEISAEIKEE